MVSGKVFEELTSITLHEQLVDVIKNEIIFLVTVINIKGSSTITEMVVEHSYDDYNVDCFRIIEDDLKKRSNTFEEIN